MVEVGGFTTLDGRSVLVTPGGEEVGSAEIPSRLSRGKRSTSASEEARLRAIVEAKRIAEAEAKRRAEEQEAQRKAKALEEQRARVEARRVQIILERKLATEKQRISKIKISRERVAQIREFKEKLRKAKEEQLKQLRLRKKKLKKTEEEKLEDGARFEQRITGTFISRGREIPIIKTIEINQKTGKERVLSQAEAKKIFPDVLTIPEKEKGIEKRTKEFKEKLRKLTIEKERGKEKKPLTNIVRESKIALLTLGTMGLETIAGVKQLPGVLAKIVKNPKVLTQVPSAIKRSGVAFGKLIRTSPTQAIVRIGGEVLLLKGTGKAFKVVGAVKGATKSKIVNTLNRVKVKGTKIELPSIKPGKTLTLKIVGGTKDVIEPLRKQIKLAGKKVTAVSGQADQLVRLIRRKRIIRKPIPGEETLKPLTQRLLKRFDEGKINKLELVNLEKRIVKETKGAGGLIERSFFADPRGRIRGRRLGTQQEEAKLLDILAGDVTFKTPKPQILVFENVQVQALPKSLAKIGKKLKTGKTLNTREANALLKFQLKKSGKFKPVGALSKESEITLAPNEIVKKVRTVGFVKIGGKRIPIVRAKVIKATQNLEKLLKKGDKGKLTIKELKLLKKKLRKETGFKNAVSRERPRPRPKLRVPKKVPRIRARRRPKTRPRKTITRPRIRRPTKKRPVVTKRVVGKRTPTIRKIVPKRIVRPTIRPPKRPPQRPPRRVTKKIPPRVRATKRIIKPKKRVKKAVGFNVFARPLKRVKGKVPKLIKINKVPLTKARAKDVRNYAVDQSLSRTARLRPTTRKPQSPKIGVPKGYAKRTNKKFRRFRIVKGKRKPLPKNKIIERTKNILDTRREKKQITLKRIIAKINKPKRITRKKKKR